MATNYISKYANGKAVDDALDLGKQAHERTESMYTKTEVDAVIQALTAQVEELTGRVEVLENQSGSQPEAPETEV